MDCFYSIVGRIKGVISKVTIYKDSETEKKISQHIESYTEDKITELFGSLDYTIMIIIALVYPRR